MRLNTMNLKYDRARKDSTYFMTTMPFPRLAVLLLLLFIPLMMGAEYLMHTVKKGESLYSIGKTYGVTVQQIQKLNAMTDIRIWQNQVLKIKEKPGSAPTNNAPKPTTTTPAPVHPAMNSIADTTSVTPPDRVLSSDFFYTIQARDNLYRIALNHGVKLDEMLRWNGFANSSHPIHPGDRIIVKDPTQATTSALEEKPDDAENTITPSIQPTSSAPSDTTVIEKIYVVQRKDTLFSISKANGMTVDDLKRINNLNSNDIKVGQVLYLAGTPPSDGSKPVKPLTDEDIQKSDKIRSDLTMPTQGKVTSEFGIRGGRPHKGIDIANKSGTPIYAVTDGVVVFSGVQGGYGNVVVLEHPDFVMTVYAHCEANVVSVDQKVSKGQLIAYMGSTGDSTGSHLHFEYRLKGKAINPRKVLPF